MKETMLINYIKPMPEIEGEDLHRLQALKEGSNKPQPKLKNYKNKKIRWKIKNILKRSQTLAKKE